jgi:hypothetical protein
MLRWLTMIVGTILIGTVILVARYDKINSTEGKGCDINCTQSSDPSAAVGSLVCTAEHRQKAKSGEYDPPWWHVFFAWPEGITALLIMLTLAAIIWQAWETRKAAEAGLESARAALLSAHASVNAERAQLLFIVKKISLRMGRAEFEIWVKNFGRTPARLIGWRAPQEVHTADPKSLPVPPVYDGNYALENYLISEGEILVAVFGPSESIHAAKRMEVARTQNVAFNNVDSVIYGQVEYLDGITHDRQTSRYCFRVERRPFRNIGGSIEPCGPPEYNYCS